MLMTSVASAHQEAAPMWFYSPAPGKDVAAMKPTTTRTVWK
jgi:hypothetical protein